MKVIDLLNKIANGEEIPEKIRYEDKIYKYDGETNNYIRNIGFNFDYLIGEDITAMLNDKVEIIEEDKEIEEAKIKTFEDTGEAVTILRVHEYNDLNFKELKRVTDELIKAVNELKKGK